MKIIFAAIFLVSLTCVRAHSNEAPTPLDKMNQIASSIGASAPADNSVAASRNSPILLAAGCDPIVTNCGDKMMDAKIRGDSPSPQEISTQRQSDALVRNPRDEQLNRRITGHDDGSGRQPIDSHARQVGGDTFTRNGHACTKVG